MKIGMIVEGNSGGADEKVYNYLARQLQTDIQVVSRALDNKPRLIERCGVAAKALLEVNKCEKVIIIWDHYPAWRSRGEKPCIVEDRNFIRDSLNKAGLTARQNECVHLVCIKHELKTDAAGEKLMKAATQQLYLSAQAYHRVLKLARTIADLADSEMIQANHLAEAIQYRSRVGMM